MICCENINPNALVGHRSTVGGVYGEQAPGNEVSGMVHGCDPIRHELSFCWGSFTQPIFTAASSSFFTYGVTVTEVFWPSAQRCIPLLAPINKRAKGTGA